jgi:hypothetical protein
LPPGLHLKSSDVNNRAVLKKKALSTKWERMFTTTCAQKGTIKYYYEGTVDSPLLQITDLIFDGNRANQGSYKKYELEQQALIFAGAKPTSKGRLKLKIHNIYMSEGVADGVHVHVNTDAMITNTIGKNLFRGAVTVTGGGSKVYLDGITTLSTDLPTGIDFEVDGLGYNNSKAVEATIKNLRLDSDFDFGVGVNSIATIDNVKVFQPPFNIYGAGKSNIKITNSEFAVGTRSGTGNRIVKPGTLSFDNVKFITFEHATNTLGTAAMHLYWNISGSTSTNQVVSCNRCTFASNTTLVKYPLYAVYSNADILSYNNYIKITNSTINTPYTHGVYMNFGGNLQMSTSTVSAKTGVYAQCNSSYKYSLNINKLVFGSNVTTKFQTPNLKTCGTSILDGKKQI